MWFNIWPNAYPYWHDRSVLFFHHENDKRNVTEWAIAVIVLSGTLPEIDNDDKWNKSKGSQRALNKKCTIKETSQPLALFPTLKFFYKEEEICDGGKWNQKKICIVDLQQK